MQRLAAHLQPFLEREVGGPVPWDVRLERGIELLRGRSETLVDMAAQARFVCVEKLELDESAARKFLTAEIAGPLRELRDALAACKEWEEPELERAFNAVIERHGLKLGKL